MRWLFAFSLMCLAALAFASQAQAGFRVNPASDANVEDGSDQDDHHDRDRGRDDNDRDRGRDDHDRDRGRDDHDRDHGRDDHDRDHGRDGSHDGAGGGNGGQDSGENEGDAGDPLKQIVRHLFVRFDANKDGNISLREAPAWLKKRFARVDTNRDGKIDPKELMEMILHARQGKRPDEQPVERPREKTGRAPRF